MKIDLSQDFPIARNSFPKLIASALASVQPMPMDCGKAVANIIEMEKESAKTESIKNQKA